MWVAPALLSAMVLVKAFVASSMGVTETVGAGAEAGTGRG